MSNAMWSAAEFMHFSTVCILPLPAKVILFLVIFPKFVYLKTPDGNEVLRNVAFGYSEWAANAFDPALVTGQRREDVSLFRFSDVRDGRLFVTQEKTGHKLAIPLDLRQEASDLLLQDVVDRCRINNPSDFMLYSSVRRGGRKPGPLTPDGLTQAFSTVRDTTGLKFGPNPPSFHEIRSLAGRLYESERGEDFAQRLLGHKNLTMTKKYLDARGAEYVMV